MESSTQLGRQALVGHIESYWSHIIKGATINLTRTAVANCKKFKNSIQQVNTKYFSTDASGIQSDAMLAGKLRYKGQAHKKVAKWLFKINEDLELFGEDVNKFPTCEMARKVIPQTLKPHVRLNYIG